MPFVNLLFHIFNTRRTSHDRPSCNEKHLYNTKEINKRIEDTYTTSNILSQRFPLVNSNIELSEEFLYVITNHEKITEKSCLTTSMIFRWRETVINIPHENYGNHSDYSESCTSAPRSDTEILRPCGSPFLSFPSFTLSSLHTTIAPLRLFCWRTELEQRFQRITYPLGSRYYEHEGACTTSPPRINRRSGHVKHPREQRPTLDGGKIIYRKGKRIVEEAPERERERKERKYKG